MDMVKMGRKGQISIPKAILERLGLTGDVPMLVETTADGAILLRPAGVYPIEVYSAGRVHEFDDADRMDAATAARVARARRTRASAADRPKRRRARTGAR